MSRTRAERRHNDIRKAIRKRNLARQLYYSHDEYPYYDNLHQYSENKIHCSCGMCSRYNKTNNKGPHRRKIHGNYAPTYNPSRADIRRLDKINFSAYDDYVRSGRKFKFTYE